MISRVSLLSVLPLACIATLGLGLAGCGREAIVSADGLPLQRVVVYRNGVAYFERSGHVEQKEVRFKMKETEVGDFLATLAVIEKGGSSVRSAAFPMQAEEGDRPKKGDKQTPDEKKGLKQIVLSLDGKAHDLQIGYVAESPVWRPSYRLVVDKSGSAYLQAWGIVQNLSGEDWKNVKLSLVAGAPLAFEAQLGVPVIPSRPVVTDQGEVIAAVPRGDTTLGRGSSVENDRDGDGIPDASDLDEAESRFDDMKAEKSASAGKKLDRSPAKPSSAAARTRASGSGAGPKDRPSPSEPPAPPPPPPPPKISAPKNLRSLAAVAVEAGSTRYDLPEAVTVPDRSSTMVMLLSRQVPGEALFLFSPDAASVPDSTSHPFRVARFANKTAGILERGPIAVFEQGSFLGQGMLDPLPSGATATVPFALDRSIAVDHDQKLDELGERIAKIENGELTIERDSMRLTRYRLRNGGALEAKLLVRHPRIQGARLHQPPPGTEDNVGTQTALIPGKIAAGGTGEIAVDERTTIRRREDWFSIIADNAVKSYLTDSRADATVAKRLSAAWALRKDIVEKVEARGKLAQEQSTLTQQTQETRANLKAIEKNKTAEQLRTRLTARLTETANRLEELSKRIVEIDSKLAESKIQFREALRDLVVTAPLPPK